jgi:hypothetical protein
LNSESLKLAAGGLADEKIYIVSRCTKAFNAQSVQDQSSNAFPGGIELTFQRSIHVVKEKMIERIKK